MDTNFVAIDSNINSINRVQEIGLPNGSQTNNIVIKFKNFEYQIIAQ
tara:strand:+ start:460 stop:600 length:141 start_codon:yes stop_codon:yes gene_type:complete